VTGKGWRFCLWVHLLHTPARLPSSPAALPVTIIAFSEQNNRLQQKRQGEPIPTVVTSLCLPLNIIVTGSSS
jgi:hypothetical protein